VRAQLESYHRGEREGLQYITYMPQYTHTFLKWRVRIVFFTTNGQIMKTVPQNETKKLV